jgi:DNA polymerase-3 subunit beta
MKLTCLQEKLEKAINLVQRAVGKNANLPILSNVLLKTDKGRLKIAATDLEVGIETWITSKVENEGEITIPAQTFSNFVSSLPSDKVSLNSDKDGLQVQCNKFKARFNGLDPEEFPIIPEVDSDPVFKIQGDLMSKILNQVQPACSFSDTRPEISGVFLKGAKEKLSFAATDSFRLAEKQVKIENDQEIELIIPLKTVQELIKATKGVKKEIEISADESQIEFRFENSRIISRLIEGDFPDYKEIIPSDFDTKVIFGRDDFKKAVKRASFFASKINDVRLEVKESGEVGVSARSQKIGENVSALEGKVEGEAVKSVFNYNYLLDGLKSINTEKVILNFTGSESPVLMKPQGDESYQYLVMPIKDTS